MTIGSGPSAKFVGFDEVAGRAVGDLDLTVLPSPIAIRSSGTAVPAAVVVYCRLTAAAAAGQHGVREEVRVCVW
eukprot:SAG31_NODE_6232_length_2108_cov_4.496267_1_plen_73_part_10